MTVKELIKTLQMYPQNMDVFMDERTTDFQYGLVNNAVVKKIKFKEEVDSEIWAEAEAVILSEE